MNEQDIKREFVKRLAQLFKDYVPGVTDVEYLTNVSLTDDRDADYSGYYSEAVVVYFEFDKVAVNVSMDNCYGILCDVLKRLSSL